mgnify:CR=1 FL=1
MVTLIKEIVMAESTKERILEVGSGQLPFSLIYKKSLNIFRNTLVSFRY